MFVFEFLSAISDLAQVADGGEIYFQVDDGRYISATEDGGFTLQEGIGGWESFSLEFREDDWVAIKTFHGTYIKAEEGQYSPLTQEQYIGGWEQFQFNQEDDGKWAIMTAHETYLRANLEDGVMDTNLGIGGWEKFKIGLVKAPDVDLSPLEGTKIAIKTAHGPFLRASDEDGVVDFSDEIGPWESFSIIPQEDGLFSFETAHGTYLRVDDEGNMNQAEEAGAWESFDIMEHADGLAFRTAHENFLSCDGEVLTTMNYRGKNETFVLYYGSED